SGLSVQRALVVNLPFGQREEPVPDLAGPWSVNPVRIGRVQLSQPEAPRGERRLLHELAQTYGRGVFQAFVGIDTEHPARAERSCPLSQQLPAGWLRAERPGRVPIVVRDVAIDHGADVLDEVRHEVRVVPEREERQDARAR